MFHFLRFASFSFRLVSGDSPPVHVRSLSNCQLKKKKNGNASVQVYSKPNSITLLVLNIEVIQERCFGLALVRWAAILVAEIRLSYTIKKTLFLFLKMLSGRLAVNGRIYVY